MGKAEALVRKTAGLARDLVPEIEVDRAKALLYDLRQEVIVARANWRIASSRLTQILRLNPGAVVVPMEPPHLQITLISPRLGVADLIPVGLASRPELASQQALVQAGRARVRQEQLRPLIPSVVVQGGSGPGDALTGSVFGGGPDNGPQLYGGRFDMGVGVVWTLNNLRAGNRSLVRERVAQEQQSAIELANTQDRVAQEVVQAHAQLEAATAEIKSAAAKVKEATITFDGTLTGLVPRRAGELLQLINRPQEATAALQQLDRAYGSYFAAVNSYNRGQFQLYRALGYPARAVICDRPVGEVQPLDTSRPPGMTPVCPYVSRPYP